MSELIKRIRHSHLQNNNPSNLIMDSNADEGNKSGIVSNSKEEMDSRYEAVPTVIIDESEEQGFEKVIVIFSVQSLQTANCYNFCRH